MTDYLNDDDPRAERPSCPHCDGLCYYVAGTGYRDLFRCDDCGAEHVRNHAGQVVA